MKNAIEVIESVLAYKGYTKREAAEKLNYSPQGFGQKLNKGYLRADEFIDILDRLGIDIEYKIRDIDKTLMFKNKGHGEPFRGMHQGVFYNTAQSIPISNTFYKDGVNEYNEEGVAEELYITCDYQTYFIVTYFKNEGSKTKVHKVEKWVADDFIENNGIIKEND